MGNYCCSCELVDVGCLLFYEKIGFENGEKKEGGIDEEKIVILEIYESNIENIGFKELFSVE